MPELLPGMVLNMSTQTEFAAFLSRMLGRSVTADEVITLSSAQQARAAGWLGERGYHPAELRPFLSKRFAPGRLAAVTPVTESAMSSFDGNKVPRPSHGPPLQIGIDIQRIDELFPESQIPDPKSSAQLTSTFTLREISYAQTRPSMRETLSGLFCAKEALRKCDERLLGTALTEIEILPDENGRPAFRGFTLSIAHSGGFAIAVAATTARA